MKFRPLLVVMTLTLASILSCSKSQEKSDIEPATDSEIAATTAALNNMNLTGVEKQLVDTLLGLWADRSNISTIDQAGAAIGVDVTDSIRAELIDKFRENRNLSKRLSVYGPYTVALTAPEKRIGQYIVRYQKARQEFPPIDSIAAVTGYKPDEIKSRLKFFSDLSFLFDLGGPDEYNKLGYSYGDRMDEVINNTGLQYHTFYIKGMTPFNVCCAKEAFYKLLKQYPNREVRYETYDPYSIQPVTVEFDNGEITDVKPESAVFLEGGYCVANCLMETRDDATKYVTAIPFVQNHKIDDPRQRLASLKQEMASTNPGN